MKAARLSPATRLVLEGLLESPTEWRYGYDLSRATLKSGTLYPVLMRLEKHALLEVRWATTDDGEPPRHTYRLARDGLDLARSELAAARGTRQFNFSKVLGALAAKGVSNTYYPRADRGFGRTVRNSGISLLTGMATSLGSEFWPDVSRKLLRR